MKKSNTSIVEEKNKDNEKKSSEKIKSDDDIQTRNTGKLGLIALCIFFGGFLVWASFAPLDEGVPTHGSVALDTKRKSVQHLTGGIIEKVLVREGDIVSEGQILLKIDDAVAKANYESSRQIYLGLLAVKARLQAEQFGENKIKWPQELIDAMHDPEIMSHINNEEKLLNTRKALLESDLLSIKESISGQLGLIESYTEILKNRKIQEKFLKEEIDNLIPLVKEGYAPRNRLLELERTLADTRSAISDLNGNTMRAKSAIAELKQRYISRQQEQRKEVETQITEVSRQVIAESEKFRSMSNDLQRTEIRSPASGQVVGLGVQTVGAVLQAGQKIMDIVPKDAPLMLEVQVPPHMIDRVTADMPVDVRFSSFANTPQLVVKGRLDSISGDLLTDQNTNATYYLARVEVVQEGIEKLGSRQLHPGMPVEVIFLGGERSMLTYLLHPLTKRIAASMTEE